MWETMRGRKTNFFLVEPHTRQKVGTLQEKGCLRGRGGIETSWNRGIKTTVSYGQTNAKNMEINQEHFFFFCKRRKQTPSPDLPIKKRKIDTETFFGGGVFGVLWDVERDDEICTGQKGYKSNNLQQRSEHCLGGRSGVYGNSFLRKSPLPFLLPFSRKSTRGEKSLLVGQDSFINR